MGQVRINLKSGIACAVGIAAILALTAECAGVYAATTGFLSKPAASLDDISNLAANPLLSNPQAGSQSNNMFHFSTTFSYANDYWFRYRDVAPNRLNIMNKSKLDISLQNFGDIYLKFFGDYSYNVRKPYLDALQQGTAGVRNGAAFSNYVPSSDFTEVDLTIAYHYELMKLIGLETGYTNFITPVNSWSSTAGAQAVEGGRGPMDAQEAYVKFTLNTQSFLHNIALNPYVYIGYDFNRAYYTSGSGEYYEAGISPTFTVPNTGGLIVNPYVSVSAIQNEKRLDVNQTSYRDGYLGTTVGVAAQYPVNSLLGIPATYGNFTAGGFVDEVFAGSRYSQPTGSHHEATVVGVSVGWNY